MQPRKPAARKRMRSLDGSSFRFERNAHTVFVNDFPAQVQVKKDGVIELRTEHLTVQVNGATYWEMIYDDWQPTPLSAGIILAKYDELVERFQQLVQGGQKPQSPAAETNDL